MKKILLLAIVILSALGAYAQNKEGDTLKIKWRKSKIWIFDEAPSAHADSIHKEKKAPNKKKFVHWGGFDIGVCMLSTYDNKLKLSDELDTTQLNTFLDLNYGKSLFFSLNPIEKNFRLYKNYLNIVTGLGIEWNSYNFKKNITLDPNAPYISSSNTTVAPDSVKYLKNKLHATYLKVPLLLEVNTNSKNPDKSFHIAGGIEVAYKIGSNTKQKYEINGQEYKTKLRDDYHLADFKYSTVVRAGYGSYCTVFVNYSLSQLFEKDNGPAVYPFTAGISIDF
jgi:hypothetical protein